MEEFSDSDCVEWLRNSDLQKHIKAIHNGEVRVGVHSSGLHCVHMHRLSHGAMICGYLVHHLKGVCVTSRRI